MFLLCSIKVQPFLDISLVIHNSDYEIRTRLMQMSTTERDAMSANKHSRARQNTHAPRAHPDYSDEISGDQIAVIHRMADPDGRRAAKRVLLYPAVV